MLLLPAADVLVVESECAFDGATWLTVRLRGAGYCDWVDEYLALPRAVRGDRAGLFILRGWDSDAGVARYSSARPWEIASRV